MNCNLIVRVCLCAVLAMGIGCQPTASEAPHVGVDLTLDPSPPHVGTADVAVILTEADGSPHAAAVVRLEGNMNHAGMKPSFADLQEVEPGRYTGRLEFTMGGDWFVLVEAKTTDGKRVERKFDVPGVTSK